MGNPLTLADLIAGSIPLGIHCHPCGRFRSVDARRRAVWIWRRVMAEEIRWTYGRSTPPELAVLEFGGMPADMSEALDRFMVSPECPRAASREEAIVLLLREALTTAGYMPAWGR